MEYAPTMTSLSLRRLVLHKTGQDLRRCRSCGVCSEYIFPDKEIDLALGTVIQLILLNDPEVFTCRTIWSDEVMEVAETLCPNGIDLAAVLRFLRGEAVLRGHT
jgi:heterodisulfide reductase subunit C